MCVCVFVCMNVLCNLVGFVTARGSLLCERMPVLHFLPFILETVKPVSESLSACIDAQFHSTYKQTETQEINQDGLGSYCRVMKGEESRIGSKERQASVVNDHLIVNTRVSLHKKRFTVAAGELNNEVKLKRCAKPKGSGRFRR